MFDSTSQALKAERALKAGGVKCAVIPTPVEFTSGCGIALVVEGDTIALDIDAGTLVVEVDDATLATRRASWKAPAPNVTTGYLARYASQVSSADKGAILA